MPRSDGNPGQKRKRESEGKAPPAKRQTKRPQKKKRPDKRQRMLERQQREAASGGQENNWKSPKGQKDGSTPGPSGSHLTHLFIDFLPYEHDKEQLQRDLADLFRPHGADVQWVVKKKGRGFAEATVRTSRPSSELCADLSGLSYQGRTLRVEVSRAHAEKKVEEPRDHQRQCFFENLPNGVTRAIIQSVIDTELEGATVEHIKTVRAGTAAFVTFATAADVARCVKALNGYNMLQTTIRVTPAAAAPAKERAHDNEQMGVSSPQQRGKQRSDQPTQTNKSILIGPLPSTITKRNILAAALRFGPVNSVQLIYTGHGGGAFSGVARIDFRKADGAAKALRGLQGQIVFDHRELTTEYFLPKDA
eukprot:TRINITY_DN4045_c0_g1_i1.p1 TRINITY_DN4045_c0_g1~~TRINITY_DN4045_c0_g1_i1.p1  ORF type:complete len:376 (+),score=62.69 TRINITY_DN4045_c0_g1_i1:42-1130(+)